MEHGSDRKDSHQAESLPPPESSDNTSPRNSYNYGRGLPHSNPSPDPSRTVPSSIPDGQKPH